MPYFQTAPLTITDLPADDDHKSGGRLGFRWIVLHHTGGTNSGAWLSTTSAPPVSVQRLISKTGKNTKIVSDDLVAFTQGPAKIKNLPRRNAQGVIVETVNEWALAIELENLGTGSDPYPPAQLDMTVAQVLEWWGAHGALPIVAHGWIQTNKNDPAGFPWGDFYRRLFARLGVLL